MSGTHPKRRPGQEVCKFYMKTGRCGYGESCKYDHPERSSKRSDSDSWRKRDTGRSLSHSVVRDPIVEFRRIIQNDPGRWRERDRRKFIQTAWNVCEQGEVLEFLNIMEGKVGNGGQMMHSILRGLKVSHCAGFISGQVSLQRVVVPVLRLMTSRNVLFTSYQMLLIPFFSVLGMTLDWESFKTALSALVAKKQVEDTIHKDKADFEAANWSPKAYADVLAPTITFCCQLLDLFESTYLSQIDSIAEVLAQGSELSKERKEDEASNLSHAIRKLTRLLVSKGGALELGKKLIEVKEKKRVSLAERWKRWFGQPDKPSPYSDPPGEKRPGGPRHDNDHVDVKDILIAPTQQEALCTSYPYLPMNRLPGEEDASLEDAIEAHREIHFRLLRYDLVSEICQSVSQLKGAGGIKALRQKGTFRAKRGEHGYEDNINVQVYRNVTVTQVVFMKHSGISYEIAFDPLPFLENKPKGYRKSFWERSKRLQHGTLCCLWREDSRKNPHLIFGVISERSAEDLCKSRSKIAIRMTNQPYNSEMVSAACAMQQGAHGGQFNSEQIMLQAGPSFFAYEHVLRALKHVQIPLPEYLLHSRESQEGQAARAMEVGIPAYLEGNSASSRGLKKYDLSFLVQDYPHADGKKNDRLLKQISSFNITDLERFPETALQRATSLDRAQAAALKAALTRKVAIIQGPPGTGKTFLGIQIVRAILKNCESSKAILPVLCVCFTNHALDQFLEGLLDSGVRARDIIRVGGRSKEDRLSRINLRNCERRKETQAEYALRKTWRENLSTYEGCLRQQLVVLSRLSNRNHYVSWRDIEPEVCNSNMYFEELLGQMGWGEPGEIPHLWQTWLRSSPFVIYDEQPYWQESHSGVDAIPTSNTFNVLQLDEEDEYPNVGVPWTTPHEGNEDDLHVPLDRTADHMHSVMEDYFEETLTREELQRLNNRDRPLEELINSDDIWMMSKKERKKLHDHWREKLKEAYKQRIQELMEKYELMQRNLKSQMENKDSSVLKGVQVVGITTTGVAMHQQLIQELKPKIMIVEEAAEVLEAHVLTSMSQFLEHLILIGDHDQLRPKTNLWDLQEDSGFKLNLDISLFERLVSQGRLPCALLETQRRMRPQFSRLIRKTVYPNLLDHQSVKEYPKMLSGMTETLFFLDHNYPESGQSDTKSKVNDYEANYSVRLARYLAQQGCWEKGDIAIVTPYVGQLLKIKEVMKEMNIKEVLGERDEELIREIEDADAENREERDRELGFGAESSGLKPSRQAAVKEVALRDCIRIATIDNFQGEEAKVVILSLTRNNEQGKIGFLGAKNRANVLLSRAKHGMYIIGNAQSLRNCKKSDMWTKVLQTLVETDKIGNELKVQCINHPETITSIRHWEDFDHLVGDGGCQLMCNAQLPCGHRCPRRCHSYDRNHRAYQCMTPTDVKLPCGHFMFNVPCCRADPQQLKCQKEVTMVIEGCPDGHENKVKCCEYEKLRHDPKNCKQMIQVTMPFCGHEMEVRCGYRHETRCTKVCELLMENSCGHPCRGVCGDCVSKTSEARKIDLLEMARGSGVTRDAWKDRMVHSPCKQECGKNLMCGHYCTEKCHHSKGECKPCKQPCHHHCSHTTEVCRRTCSDPCIPCAENCQWECRHKGRCHNACGVPCTRLPCNERCDKKLACGCRCPSVCGEVCPSKKYCLIHGSREVKNQVVEFITMQTFGELQDEDVTVDPVIVLKCGHVFQMSTMDQHMEMSQYYEEERRGNPSRWGKIKPLSSDIERRKNCIQCRAAISGVFRYGRCVNKVDLDQLELRFVRDCETQLMKKEKERVELETNFQDKIDVITTQEASQLGWAIEKAMGELDLIAERAQRTPKVILHEKQEAAIHAHLEKSSGQERELVEEEMMILGAPKLDLSRHCKALLTWIKFGILRLAVHSKHMHKTIVLNTGVARGGSDMQKAQRMQQTRKLVNVCDETYGKIMRNVESALDVATRTVSITSEVLAYMLKVQLIVNKFEFLMQSTAEIVAEALGRSYNDLAEDVQEKQKKLIEEAKATISKGLERARSSAQREELQSLQASVNQLVPNSVDCSLEVLMAILRHDTRISSESFGSGHIYTCPNGHIYLIGECGQAMQSSRCPDCGATIGGGGHRLTSNNRRADNIVRDLRSRYAN